MRLCGLSFSHVSPLRAHSNTRTQVAFEDYYPNQVELKDILYRNIIIASLGFGIRKRPKFRQNCLDSNVLDAKQKSHIKPKCFILFCCSYHRRASVTPFSVMSYPMESVLFYRMVKKVFERDGVFTLAQLWPFWMMTDVQKQIQNVEFLNSLRISNISNFVSLSYALRMW